MSVVDDTQEVSYSQHLPGPSEDLADSLKMKGLDVSILLTVVVLLGILGIARFARRKSIRQKQSAILTDKIAEEAAEGAEAQEATAAQEVVPSVYGENQ